MKIHMLIFVLLLTFNKTLISSPEVTFCIPLSASFSIPIAKPISSDTAKEFFRKIDYSKIVVGVGYNTGFLVQVGGSVYIENKKYIKGFSIVSDIGYYLYSYNAIFDVENDPNLIANEQRNYFHTVYLGGLFKVNMKTKISKPFSLGIGAGIMLPFSYKEMTLYTEDGKKAYKDEYKYNFNDINKIFKYPIIPYIKLTFDGYYYISRKSAIVTSVYLSYDFGMLYNVSLLNTSTKPNPPFFYPLYSLELKKYSFSSISLGIMIGFYIGRES